jgi:hypothetical protein
MKKTSVLLTGFLLFIITLRAQEKQSKFFAEFGVGPSFPIGDFAKKTYNGTDNNLPGFAMPGLGFNLSMGYHINESLGLLVLGGYSINPQDEKAYKQYIQSKVSNINSITVDAKNWNIAKLMAGGFFVTPLTADSALVLRTKLTVGVCKTAVPEFEYAYTSQNRLDTILGAPAGWYAQGGRQGKVSLPWSFCYQVSVGLKFKLNKNLYALFDISSFNATAEGDYMFYIPGTFSTSTGGTIVAPPPPSKTKFKLGSVNAQAGVALRL